MGLLCLVNPPELKGRISDRDKAGGLGVARPAVWFGEGLNALPTPPMDWLYAAAIAEQEGMSVKLVDALGDRLSLAQTVESIAQIGPDIVGIRLSLPSLDQDLRLAQRLAEAAPERRVFVFGACIQTTLNEWGSRQPFDVFFGEVEALLPFYLRGQAVSAIGRWGEALTDKVTWQFVSNLDDLPMPAWHLLDPRPYSPSGRKEDLVYYLNTSRGCPKACTMCPYYVHQGAVWRSRSVQHVLAEVQALVARGARYIQTRDPNISWRKAHLLSLMQASAELQGLEWTIETDLEALGEEDLIVLRRGGVVRIMTGVESLDEAVIKDVGQNTQAMKRVLQNMRVCEALGIKVTGFFMIGAPSETWESVIHTLQVAQGLPCDYSVSLMTPYRGTSMREQVIRAGLTRVLEPYSSHNGHQVVARTRQMTRLELGLAFRWVQAELNNVAQRERRGADRTDFGLNRRRAGAWRWLRLRILRTGVWVLRGARRGVRRCMAWQPSVS